MAVNAKLANQLRGSGIPCLWDGFLRLPLILPLLLVVAPLFPQGDMNNPAGTSETSVSRQMGLVLSSDTSWCLTDTECSFSVVLPEVSPSQVEIGNPRLPETVRFLSAHKDLSLPGGTGTSIRVLLSFSQVGTFQLPPLDVMIDGAWYQLPFAPVEVFQNPRSLRPEMQLSFQQEDGRPVQLTDEGGVPAQGGKPLLLTVSLRYTAHLDELVWQLVPDVLFQQLEDLQEEFNQGAGEFSHQFHPVARFQLFPLRSGVMEVPPLQLEVSGYDGERHRLLSQPMKVVVDTAPAAQDQGRQLEPALASAFAQPATEGESPQIAVSLDRASELARLRRQERYSLPLSSIRQNRILREQELGLEPGRGEVSRPLVWSMAGFGGLLLILLVLSLLKKKFFLSVGLGFCLILVTGMSVIYSRPLFQPTGVLASRTLSKIPEVDAAHHFSVAPYSLVEIRQQVMGWYYVSAGGLEGWVLREQVVPIELEER